VIFEVIGTAAPGKEVQPLFSAEVIDVQMMDQLLLTYKLMGLIPGAETFEVTEVIPNGTKHEYHVPRLLISYWLNSYRQSLEKQLH